MLQLHHPHIKLAQLNRNLLACLRLRLHQIVQIMVQITRHGKPSKGNYLARVLADEHHVFFEGLAHDVRGGVGKLLTDVDGLHDAALSGHGAVGKFRVAHGASRGGSEIPACHRPDDGAGEDTCQSTRNSPAGEYFYQPRGCLLFFFVFFVCHSCVCSGLSLRINQGLDSLLVSYNKLDSLLLFFRQLSVLPRCAVRALNVDARRVVKFAVIAP